MLDILECIVLRQSKCMEYVEVVGPSQLSDHQRYLRMAQIRDVNDGRLLTFNL